MYTIQLKSFSLTCVSLIIQSKSKTFHAFDKNLIIKAKSGDSEGDIFLSMFNVHTEEGQRRSFTTQSCGCVSLHFHLLPLFIETFSRKFRVQLYYCVLTCLWFSDDLYSHSFLTNLSLLVFHCLNLTSAKVLYDMLFLCAPSVHLHISIICCLSVCFFTLHYSPVGREVLFKAYPLWKEFISLFVVGLVQEGLRSNISWWIRYLFTVAQLLSWFSQWALNLGCLLTFLFLSQRSFKTK